MVYFNERSIQGNQRDMGKCTKKKGLHIIQLQKDENYIEKYTFVIKHLSLLQYFSRSIVIEGILETKYLKYLNGHV